MYVIMTPLGFPVVPLEYGRTIRSWSGSRSRGLLSFKGVAWRIELNHTVPWTFDSATQMTVCIILVYSMEKGRSTSLRLITAETTGRHAWSVSMRPAPLSSS